MKGGPEYGCRGLGHCRVRENGWHDLTELRKTGDTLLETIVAEIDAEIAKLQQARVLLLAAATPAKRGPGRPAKTRATTAPRKTKRRTISPEAR